MEEEEQREIRKTTLQALLKEAKVRHKKTVLGVPGQSVFTRPRALPPVPEYKLSQIVRYEIQQLIPFPLENVAWGYQVLNVTEAGGYDVLMAAIKVEVVEKRLEILRDVKKSIDTVDVCPLAAYNWFKYTGEFGDQGETVALLDLGAATTDIVIEREGQFRFTRSLNIGGNDITKAIGESFEMEHLKAEQLKREKGFAPTGDPQRDGKGGEVIGRVLNRLVGEINRSFGYFRAQPGGGPVSRVVVTGGGACLRNIIPYLQRQLGVEVRIAQPLAGLAIAPGAQEVNERPEQAAVALGLALRCRESVPLEINLIPPRILEAARRREQLFYWALSVATLLLILASIIPAREQQNQEANRRIDLAMDVFRQYDARMIHLTKPPDEWKSAYEAELTQYQAEVDQEKTKQKILDNARNNRIVWLKYLNAVNDARPKGKLVVFSVIESTIVRKVAAGSTGGGGGGAAAGGRGGLGAAALSLFGGRGAAAPPPEPEVVAPEEPVADTGETITEVETTGFQSLGSNDLFQNIDNLSSGQVADATRAKRGAPSPLRPNGLRIRGYVSDKETLQEFLANLRDSGAFVKNGVYFNDRWTEPVSKNVLYDAPTTIAGGAPAANTGGGAGGGTGGGFNNGANFGAALGGGIRVGGRGGRGGRGGGSTNTGGFNTFGQDTIDLTRNAILTFTVNVQFGPPPKGASAAAVDSGGGGRGGGRGGRAGRGGGRGGRRGR
jgi:type IV pilus assembly protein PilM